MSYRIGRFTYALIGYRAMAALNAASRHDWPKVGRIIEKINRHPAGVVIAMQHWIDASVYHASGSTTDVIAGSVVVFDHSTGKVLTPGAVDKGPQVAWALDVIDARSTMNPHAFRAAVRELAEVNDGAEIARRLGVLLHICADSIDNMPRGYAQLTAELKRRQEKRAGL